MESGRKEDGTTGKGSDSVGKDRKRVPAGVPLTVKRSNIRYEEDRHGHKVTVFALPCTKTSGKGEDMLFARQPGPTDPQDALENHLHVNIAPNESHLFSYRHRQGELVPLSRADFLGHLTCTFADAELELLQGHGIRIGATLEYLLYMRTFFRDSKANRTLEVRSIYSLSTETRTNPCALCSSASCASSGASLNYIILPVSSSSYIYGVLVELVASSTSYYMGAFAHLIPFFLLGT